MAYWIALILVAAGCINALNLNNSHLSNESYEQSGAIKFNGSYYLVASSTTESRGLLPLHKSTDLIEWTPEGFVIDASNTPPWAIYKIFHNPEIHQIADNFLVYFSTLLMINLHYEVWVASAPHPLGPYTFTGVPMLSLTDDDAETPSIINDEGKLYLLWVNKFEVKARLLDSNGLSFSSNLTTTLLKPSLSWEEGHVYSPWYIRRGPHHYLLYSGGSDCTNTSVGAARSDNALGPYEKLANPILVSNSEYQCIGDVSVVKDLDNQSDVIFLTGHLAEDSGNYYSVMLASLGWNTEDWPYVDEL